MIFPLWISFPYHCLILYTFFCVIFNHFMAWIIKPGNLKNLRADIEMLKKKKIFGKYNSNEKIFKDNFWNENPSLEMRHLIRFRFKELPTYDPNTCPYYCLHCKELKLILAHHCSIWNDWILMRDHHCPWINNWVGMHNARYFLLFLFYILWGWIEALIPTYLTIRTPPFSNDYYGVLASSLTMSLVMGAMMIGYNLYTVAKIGNIWSMGDPTLKFWEEKAKTLGVGLYDSSNPEHMKFQGIRDNLFKTFGTRSFFRMILPSMRDLPFFGHEWTLEIMELDAELAAMNTNGGEEMDDYVL